MRETRMQTLAAVGSVAGRHASAAYTTPDMHRLLRMHTWMQLHRYIPVNGHLGSDLHSGNDDDDDTE